MQGRSHEAPLSHRFPHAFPHPCCFVPTRFPTQTGMEPDLVTEDRLLPILQELIAREPIFHRPEHGATRAAFEAMTDAGFWEVGASGRRYSRAHVLDVLDQRRMNPQEDVWEARDFHCREIAQGSYLLTYTLVQGARVTRRSTIWRRTAETWQILFHQGTVVEADGA